MFDTLKALLGWPWFPRRKPDPLPEKETDLAYGPDPLQKLDVYRPPNTMPGDKLPVILMVHGGGWDNTLGDKANAGVIDNKAAYYVQKGYVVVSMNYRLYTPTNGITPLEEAQDVASALAYARAKVAGVGDVTLMGHSAGAHLVALVATRQPGIRAVCLDSGCFDVEQAVRISAKTGSDLYAPFGTDPGKWPAMSPIDNVTGPTGPWLLAYSTQRGPADAKQTDNFAAMVRQYGGTATTAGFDLSHGDMDAMVGKPGPLTDAIDKFLG